MAPGPNDATLEILMCDLDQENASRLFYPQSGLSPSGRAIVTEQLQSIYRDATIDEFMFEPCGYSCNGVTPNGYFTVHVTPEAHCSYASFETNISPEMNAPSPKTFAAIISSIVQLFQPGRFTVTLFTEKDLGPESSAVSLMDASNNALQTIGNAVRGFDRTDKIIYEFENYDLMFYHYVRDHRSSPKQLALCQPGER